MNHIIKKQILELSIAPQLDAFQVQQQISEHFWNHLAGVLEKQFDSISTPDEVIFIDRLEIDLGVVSVSEINKLSWNGELLAKIKEPINEILSKSNANIGDGISKYSRPKGVFKQWFFYMKKGFLAWNSVQINAEWHNQVLEVLANDHESLTELKTEIKLNEVVLARIVEQHSEAFLVKLIELVSAEKHTDLPAIISEIKTIIEFLNNKKQKKINKTLVINQLWENALIFSTQNSKPQNLETLAFELLRNIKQDIFIDEKITQLPIKLLFPIIQKIQKKAQENNKEETNNFKKVEPKSINAEKSIGNIKQSIAEEESIFVENAGLVLVHPFISYFFTHIGLVEGKQFKNIEAQQKALYLLHYIATKNTEAEEHELLIPKILCGYTSEMPVPRKMKLSKKEKTAADSMLEAVIAQWTILKNTSPDGLIEGFLRRNGKLSIQKNEVNIMVEANAIDVLLDQLPWNLSMIKLPWLDEFIHVAWR